MPCANPQVGAIGVRFKATIVDQDGAVVNVSAASGAGAKKIYLQKPTVGGVEGAVLEKTASFFTDGTDGIIYYDTIAGDLDVAGNWKWQGYVAGVGGFTGRSRAETVRVLENLEA